jgi:hypothetical protein
MSRGALDHIGADGSIAVLGRGEEDLANVI